MAVGYDNTKRMMTVRNSWGASWGAQGYFYMPYEFIISSNTSDFWTIRSVG
jgi:C1A family cysteine protease